MLQSLSHQQLFVIKIPCCLLILPWHLPVLWTHTLRLNYRHTSYVRISMPFLCIDEYHNPHPELPNSLHFPCYLPFSDRLNQIDAYSVMHKKHPISDMSPLTSQTLNRSSLLGKTLIDTYTCSAWEPPCQWYVDKGLPLPPKHWWIRLPFLDRRT